MAYRCSVSRHGDLITALRMCEVTLFFDTPTAQTHKAEIAKRNSRPKHVGRKWELKCDKVQHDFLERPCGVNKKEKMGQKFGLEHWAIISLHQDLG